MADRGHAQGSLLDEALRSTTRAVASAPKVTLLLLLVVTGACVALTACFLGFKTDRADLIDPNASYQKRWLAYTQNFGAGSDVVLVVESEDPAAVRSAIDFLGDKIGREKELFSNVLYRIETTNLRRKGLQFLPPDRIQDALRQLDQYQPVLQGRQWNLVTLDKVTDRLAWQLKNTQSRRDEGLLLQQTERFADSLASFVENPRRFDSPWPEMFPVDPQFQQATDRPVYFLFHGGRMGIIKASPQKAAAGFDGATAAIDRLRALGDEAAKEIPGVKVTLTGIPVLESDEMRGSSYDMTVASVLSFIGVGLLLVIGFRGLRHPVLAMVMLGIGLAWAFGFTTFSVGHLNILSVSFAAMLIGLGGDFAIHYLSRYLEERQGGLDLAEALEATSVGIGSGLITASLTTALAFFCATFTQFLGVAELGIIAGGGLLLCALATFLAMPALIALADDGLSAEDMPKPFRVSWLRLGTSKFPMVTVFLSVAVIGGVTACAFRLKDKKPEPVIKYDHNLLNLQPEGLESVQVLRKLFSDGDQSLLFAVSLADSREDAIRLERKFAALPSVKRVENLASMLPQAPPQQTQDLLRTVRSRLGNLPDSMPALPDPSPANVGRALERLYQTTRQIDDEDARRVGRKLNAFLDSLEKLPFERQAVLLTAYQQRTAAALLKQFHVMQMASDPEPLSASDLPKELTSRFVSPQGKWLLQIYPKDQIWDYEPLAKFVADVRSVDPDVTGTPLQNFEASRQIKGSYETAALYALVVISLVLLLDFLEGENKLLVLVPPLVVIGFTAMTLSTRGVPIRPMYLVLGYLGMVVAIAAILDFRNLRDAALCLLPPVAAGGMTVGILALLKQDLNAANLIVLPLILGIGVDNGVYVVHNCRSQKGKAFTLDASTTNAMAISSLTNMVGFGSLMIASHRGLFGVGLVLTVGVACVLFVSLTTLPAIMAWMTKERRSGKHASRQDEGLEAATRPDPRQQNQQQKRRAA
jgi:hopanoid biosynthesis associated RND transporter like protein HpnN